MRELILVVASVALSGLNTFFWAYRIGYDQGRNDGFHQGWRECQQKEEAK